MPSDQTVLAFDTSAAHCAAALFWDGAVRDRRVETIAKGQAERLLPMLEELLARNGKDWRSLTRIGVGIGPGNFTGIRISVSAARGLALGLGIPAIGVSTLQAIHHLDPGVVAAVAGPRDTLYVQSEGGTPRLVQVCQVENPVFATDIARMVGAMAECAANADPSVEDRPKPLYIKPADAAPSRDAAPAILS